MLAMATLISGAALAKSGKPPAPPKNLRGFLLRPSEPLTHVFPRTPAFAWAPVRGALCYEFELATSRAFSESSVVWSNVRNGVKPGTGCAAVAASLAAPVTGTGSGASGSGSGSTTGASGAKGATGATGATGGIAGSTGDPAVSTTIPILRVPAVSVDVSLPWFTGQPYALYSHVRAITLQGPTGWSTPFEFNMRWLDVPTPLESSPGFVRWKQVPRCDQLSGVVPAGRQGVLVPYERRRRAGVLQFPSRQELVDDGAVARARRTPGVRGHSERASGRLVWAVEPRLYRLESGRDAGQDPAPDSRVRHDQHGRASNLTRAHAGPDIHRQPGAQRQAVPPVSCLRLDRHRLRQHRLSRPCRR